MPEPTHKKLCFVIGPIGAPGSDARRHADWLLKGIIRPVFKEHFSEFEVTRADELATPGNINSQVINRLWEAALVVADMSLHNANAFYELAIRHMNQMPTIHMIQKGYAIPFDNASYRTILFDYADPAEIEAAQIELKASVEATLQPDFRADNPIVHARGVLKLREIGSENDNVILDMVSDAQRRLANLEDQSARMPVLGTMQGLSGMGDILGNSKVRSVADPILSARIGDRASLSTSTSSSTLRPTEDTSTT